MIKFRVEGEPVAKGRPRFARRGNFVMAYTPQKTKDAEAGFLAQAIKFKPQIPLTGALGVNLIFSKLKPKSKPKKERFWTTRPDIDNLQKLIDSMNGVFWVDDAQIVDIRAIKVFGDSAYTEVMIWEIDEFDEMKPRGQKKLVIQWIQKM